MIMLPGAVPPYTAPTQEPTLFASSKDIWKGSFEHSRRWVKGWYPETPLTQRLVPRLVMVILARHDIMKYFFGDHRNE